MKILVIPFLVFLFFISCKKDRSCICTTADGTKVKEATYIHTTKKEARKFCTYNNDPSITCTVK